jgi:protoporphyrinogen oxidase
MPPHFRFFADETFNSLKKAIIIGAGPAGLTAALELVRRTDIKPVILEMDNCVGGIARTVNFKGNRIDIGGHRFFSKSDRVMDWWLEILPLEHQDSGTINITYHNRSREIDHADEGPDAARTENVMLVRNRKSRIYYNRKFFDYPISLSLSTFRQLGFAEGILIGLSYLRSALFPIANVSNLEQFFINRFGRRLYRTFFRDYTEKVWGKPCTAIDASWGEQRIKGLSVRRALLHMFRNIFAAPPRTIYQKGTETSLIEHFLYPKYGPGHMWSEVLNRIQEGGGEIHFNKKVMEIEKLGNQITAVTAYDTKMGLPTTYSGDYFFSTMPVKDMVNACQFDVHHDVKRIANGLEYRDFFTIGLLVNKLNVQEGGKIQTTVDDNWIYIQEPDVRIGRLQVFNNWSPYMVKSAARIWLGLEYFCYDTDEIWKWEDDRLIEHGAGELEKIGIIDRADVVEGLVIRMPKTYPAYFGTYGEFDKIIRFAERFGNLYLVGRNGMHKYNNQDHSMLTAMTAVDNIIAGRRDKSNIWAVNTEQEYHEERD